MTVTILDYGAGNLTSVLKAFRAIGAAPRATSSALEIESAAVIVVPGVGHFAATKAIDPATRAAIRAAVDRGASLLGICLGLQWLFDGSDEAPGIDGLAAFPGRCFDLKAIAGRSSLKVPHVGWNTLEPTCSSPLLDGVRPGSALYFSHSYAVPLVGDTIARTDHGVAFSAIVARDRIAGVQFHPEKSGRAGLRILTNFLLAAQRGLQC